MAMFDCRGVFHRLALLAGAAFLAVATGVVPASAQDAGAPEGQAAQQQPAPPPWSTRCLAPNREGPLDCAMEQRAVVTETGQLLILVTLRVPADTRKPVMAIQAPLSIFLPAGVAVDVDGESAFNLDFQMCDANGCYAATPISDAFRDAMFKGLKMNVTIQNLNKQQLKVPMSLAGFTEIYNRVR